MNRTATFGLTLTRYIRAPREKVFDAFIQAEHAKNWMCPRGMTIPAAEFDARVGGSYRITMRARASRKRCRSSVAERRWRNSQASMIRRCSPLACARHSPCTSV